MESSQYSIGQAVFLRTDAPDYAEETFPFKSLDELSLICAQGRSNLILEKIIIYSLVDGEPVSLTLGFISASKGQRPGSLETAGNKKKAGIPPAQ